MISAKKGKDCQWSVVSGQWLLNSILTTDHGLLTTDN